MRAARVALDRRSAAAFRQAWYKTVVSPGQSAFLRDYQLPRDEAHVRALMQGALQSQQTSSAPAAVTQALTDAYAQWSLPEKEHFLGILGRDLGPDAEAARAAAAAAAADPDPARLRRLRRALRPLYESLFERIVAQLPEGMEVLVNVRADVRRILRAAPAPVAPELRALDADLQAMLARWFSVGFLELQQLTFHSTPASVLQQLLDGENVHRLGSISDFQERLSNGRRCFAFFHPSMPGVPLVFIHVALMPRLARSMREVLTEATESDPQAAIFYSINATQPGLSGVDLGHFLIKRVVQELRRELPSLTTFSTLSPVPGLARWALPRLRGEPLGTAPLVSDCDSPSASPEFVERQLAAPTDEGREVLMGLAERYLLQEKRHGRALCPVANFHLRNGAALRHINWAADDSDARVAESAGIMVNYEYELPFLTERSEGYEVGGEVVDLRS